jgi:hypothetical protein
LQAARSDIYFTDINHQHTGFGNSDGYAAIENAINPYNALMILGRKTAGGRIVKLWDYLQVNGNLDATGAVTAGGNLSTSGGLSVTGAVDVGSRTFVRLVFGSPGTTGAGTINIGDWTLRADGNTLQILHNPPLGTFVVGGGGTPAPLVVAEFKTTPAGTRPFAINRQP